MTKQEKKVEPKTIAEVAAQFASDKKATKKAVEQAIIESTVVNYLIMIRHDRGMTQGQIAESMGCSVSTVSRIEGGTDRDLNLVDLHNYAKAIGVKPTILFEPRDTHSSLLIKQFVFGIHDRLEHLAKIAQESDGDYQITEKINQFFGEVLFNFIKRFEDAFNSLPKVNKSTKAGKKGNKERGDYTPGSIPTGVREIQELQSE